MALQSIDPRQIFGTPIPGATGWLASFASGGQVNPVAALGYLASASQLPMVLSKGIAITGAVQAIDSPTGASAANIGLAGIAVNNKAGLQKAWGAYIQADRTITGAGNATGVEVDISQQPGTSPLGGLTPYRDQVDGITRGIGVSAGSDAAVYGRSYAVDAAITTNNNGAAFWAGLVFRHNSLMREGLADDRSIPSSTGYAKAILMGHDHGLSWYSRDPVGGSGTQAEAVRMWSTVDDPTVLWGMAFRDGGLDVHERSGTSNSLFVVDYIAAAVDFLAVKAGAAGQGVKLQARGGANAGISIEPAGAGGVFIPLANVPAYAGDAAASAGGVSVGQLYFSTTANALTQRRV
jgi:hypothetical protein